jgi:hypothetical protein
LVFPQVVSFPRPVYAKKTLVVFFFLDICPLGLLTILPLGHLGTWGLEHLDIRTLAMANILIYLFPNAYCLCLASDSWDLGNQFQKQNPKNQIQKTESKNQI